MKIALLLGVFLFFASSERTVSGEPGDWLQDLSSQMKRLEQKLQETEEKVKAKVQKAEAEVKAETKQAYADLNSIKQKCASANGNKGSLENGETVGLTLQETNGVQQFYEQIYNPTTKKIEQNFYSIDTKDPEAKPVCGKPTQ